MSWGDQSEDNSLLDHHYEQHFIQSFYHLLIYTVSADYISFKES